MKPWQLLRPVFVRVERAVARLRLPGAQPLPRGSSLRFPLVCALQARLAVELLPRHLAGFLLLPVIVLELQRDDALPLRRSGGLLPRPDGERLHQHDVGPLLPPAGERVQPRFAALPLPRDGEPLLRPVDALPLRLYVAVRLPRAFELRFPPAGALLLPHGG